MRSLVDIQNEANSNNWSYDEAKYLSKDEKYLYERLGRLAYHYLGPELRVLFIDALSILSLARKSEGMTITNISLLLIPLACVLEATLFKIADSLGFTYNEKSTIGQVFSDTSNLNKLVEAKASLSENEQLLTIISFIRVYRNEPIHGVAKQRIINIERLEGKKESMLDKVHSLVELLDEKKLIETRKKRPNIGIREWGK